MKQVIISVLIITMFSACNKDETLPNVEADVAVVEAFLEPGRELTIALSKMLPFTEDEFTGSLIIDTAEVYINYQGVDYLFTPVSEEPGKYKCPDSNLKVIAGDSYGLHFEYKGSFVNSVTIVPSKPINTNLSTNVYYIDSDAIGPGASQEPLIVSWNNPDNSYHLIVIEYLEPTYDPINENLNEETYDGFRKVSTDPELGSSYNLDTRQHIVFFGSYRIIIYKINEEYVNLYENISQSTLSLGEPLTNIENGLGIFTGINSDTLFLEVKKL